jgi:hypothetical protein
MESITEIKYEELFAQNITLDEARKAVDKMPGI